MSLFGIHQNCRQWGYVGFAQVQQLTDITFPVQFSNGSSYSISAAYGGTADVYPRYRLYYYDQATVQIKADTVMPDTGVKLSWLAIGY